MIMANEHTRVIDGTASIKSALDWAYQLITKGLPGGAVEVAIRRHEEKRSTDQNSRQWAMFTDLSNQLEWYGQKLTPTHWKELLSNEWQAQTIVPGISGGLCPLGVSTSKMRKREMSELIEIVMAFGSERGVIWSDPALKVFEEYNPRA